jgi:hypothetical protein
MNGEKKYRRKGIKLLLVSILKADMRRGRKRGSCGAIAYPGISSL